MHRAPSSNDMSRFIRRGLPNKLDVSAPLGNRKTKIICTIGPSCQSVDVLAELIRAGMNVARLNFSHGTHEYHLQTVNNIREATRLVGLPVAIMLDMKGPAIRTTKLKGGKPIMLVEGQRIKFKATADRGFLGDSTIIGIDYVNMPKALKVGSLIRVADGLIGFVVESISGDEVTAIVQNSAEIGEYKNCNLPGSNVDIAAITPQDKLDLVFAAKQNLDMIAASFVRQGDEFKEIREIIGEEGKNIKIIAKIESQQGLDNFVGILQQFDGIMVARGDMGVEIPIQKVCMAQKRLIRACNVAGKPVITATQMLESMTTNPRPTRAEATDVANAVFDGTDCVMLSGETAKGRYPVQTVKTMARICVTAELAIDNEKHFDTLIALSPKPLSRPEAIASAAVKLEFNMDAAIIIVLTESGASAQFVSKYRPSVPIITVTTSERIVRQILISQACWPLLVPQGLSDREMTSFAVAYAKKEKWVSEDDWVVVVSGTQGIKGSVHSINILQVRAQFPAIEQVLSL